MHLDREQTLVNAIFEKENEWHNIRSRAGTVSTNESLAVAQELMGLKKEYAEVRRKHKDGIKMLEKEFGYHPSYKKGREGEFSASYFTPVRDPNDPNKK